MSIQTVDSSQWREFWLGDTDKCIFDADALIAIDRNIWMAILEEATIGYGSLTFGGECICNHNEDYYKIPAADRPEWRYCGDECFSPEWKEPDPNFSVEGVFYAGHLFQNPDEHRGDFLVVSYQYCSTWCKRPYSQEWRPRCEHGVECAHKGAAIVGIRPDENETFGYYVSCYAN